LIVVGAPPIAVTAVVFIAPDVTAATAATMVIVVLVVIIIVAIVVIIIVVIIIAIAVAVAAIVPTVAAAITVTIATTTTAHLCFSCRWLVVALLSAVRFHHHTPSCNCQLSCCWPLSPPIIVHCCCCHCYRCRQAATATTLVKLTNVHCQRKRQEQKHHWHTNSSTNVKTFTNPDDLDLFNLSTAFKVCDVGQVNLAMSKLLSLKKMYLFAIYITYSKM
jgi:hypothetical protein